MYKQATVGENNTSEPWAIQLEAHAKWGAWKAEKGKSKEVAQAEYLDYVNTLRPKYK